MGMTLVVPPARDSAAEAPANPLVFAGSGGNLALTRVLVEAYAKVRPEIKIDVPASIGSSGAIRAAAEGAMSVGLIARPLKDEEQKLGLTVLPYARTVIVIGVHPTVADDGITSEDLVRIYKKTKTS